MVRGNADSVQPMLAKSTYWGTVSTEPGIMTDAIITAKIIFLLFQRIREKE